MASFKRINRILLAGTACLALASCDGSDSVASPGEGVLVVPATPAPAPSPTASPTPTSGPAASCPAGTESVGTIANTYRSCRLPSSITGALSLPRATGVAYELNGRVDVGVDVGGAGTTVGGTSGTLTIAPGAVVYANTTNTDNDFLVVNRGSRMVAEGTEALPIIFTAQQNLAGTVTDESQGLWGGIIMAGRAPISNCLGSGIVGGTAQCENLVEGTTTALYGGATPTDNSGIVRYVQIRYSGTIISPNNELQGLTLAGTGSGTTIDRVQVHNSSDDGVEIFGGRTNLRYLALTGADDDGLDTDVGWQGFAQFVLAIQRPNNTTGDNFSTEIDSNNAEDALPRQRYNLANFTFVSTSTATTAAIRLRGGADARFVNGLVTAPRACLNIVAGTTDNGGKSTIRPANAAVDDQGPPIFNSVLFNCATPFTSLGDDGRTLVVNSVTVTEDEQRAVFTATPSSGNNEAAGVILNGFLPTGAALTAAAFNAATLNPTGTSFLVSTNFLGAVNGANDTSFQRWTCNSNRANFGPNSTNCTAAPAT
ncbi:hypothetical protein [uncultured Sphingomonas sp.]|uniref:hypothetical protein n=1 Tax=uncultured Sphingomonas sp. TaxID=158754 RepID=UPI0035CA2ED7